MHERLLQGKRWNSFSFIVVIVMVMVMIFYVYDKDFITLVEAVGEMNQGCFGNTIGGVSRGLEKKRNSETSN